MRNPRVESPVGKCSVDDGDRDKAEDPGETEISESAEGVNRPDRVVVVAVPEGHVLLKDGLVVGRGVGALRVFFIHSDISSGLQEKNSRY